MLSDVLPKATEATSDYTSHSALKEEVVDGLRLAGATRERAAGPLCGGPATASFVSPTHQVAKQDAPPKDCMLPVKIGSIRRLLNAPSL